jgi:hypothetical protein
MKLIISIPAPVVYAGTFGARVTVSALIAWNPTGEMACIGSGSVEAA